MTRRLSRRRFPATLILSGALLASCTQAPPPLDLGEGEVVVVTGGADMVRLQRAGYLETILTDAFAGVRPAFRDLSLGRGHRLPAGLLAGTLAWKTDSATGTPSSNWSAPRLSSRQFGKLESMTGSEGLESFRSAYDALIDGFLKQADQVVLVSPTPFEKPASEFLPDLEHHNRSLARYVRATKRIAAQRGLLFVDLFSDAEPDLTENGMHLKEDSLRRVSETIAQELGFEVPAWDRLATLRAAVVEKQRLWFDYWRPANWKLLHGDDSTRRFTRSSHGYLSFREEWQQLVGLIEKAEERVWTVANGGPDPGHQRPEPEELFGHPAADIEAELASFTVPDGMQVNLFASEADGLTNPLAIRWDTAGRAYVTVTTAYPHVFPGDAPNDKIVVLEDADRDGVAESSTVFADGLNMPMAMELGDGGVYVGQGHELLFLEDTDGDGRADARRVLLGGFGTGDAHQTINSFVWSPGGELYMGQGRRHRVARRNPLGVRRPVSVRVLPAAAASVADASPSVRLHGPRQSLGRCVRRMGADLQRRRRRRRNASFARPDPDRQSPAPRHDRRARRIRRHRLSRRSSPAAGVPGPVRDRRLPGESREAVFRRAGRVGSGSQVGRAAHPFESPELPSDRREGRARTAPSTSSTGTTRSSATRTTSIGIRTATRRTAGSGGSLLPRRLS